MKTFPSFLINQAKIYRVVFLVILLNACGGDGSNSNTGGTPSNMSPTANAGSDQAVDEQTMVSLNGGTSSDSDGSISTYAWSQTAGAVVTLDDASSATPSFSTPTLSVAETLVFQLTVTDDQGATASDSVNITVNPVNLLPVASAGSDQTVDEQALVTLNAMASMDSDGTISSYLWSQTAGTPVTLSDNSASNPSFTTPEIDSVETMTFTVTVTDNEGGTAMASVEIIVNPISDNSVKASALEPAMLLNELYFEYANQIGDKVWVVGFYGNTTVNSDGAGFLVDNMLRLEVDEQFSHHSFARVDGALPPDSWHGNQILVYGEIKDYVVETGDTDNQPTPLITVEKYELVSLSSPDRSWEDSFITPDILGDVGNKLAAKKEPLINYVDQPKAMPIFAKRAPGTQAQACDRSIIISGGINRSNNHQRYIDNVVAKFNKMKELGFDDDQIEVFYNNGGPINIDGNNVVDAKTSLATIGAHIEQLAEDMPGSCTLTIFVTDHGAGHNQEQGYTGAKPVFSGAEFDNGKRYEENSFAFDARKKVYRTTDNFVFRGALWFFAKDEAGGVEVYKRVGDKWVYKGKNNNGDGIISETELGGEDLNGDGDSTDTDYGLSVSILESRLNAQLKYLSNEWDTDGDDIIDVRVRWDGQRFVVERLNSQNEWQEMGRDSNGDYFIDIIDGGVDWNLDGDVADEVGFHESINLWGSEELYDDAFADMLKPLSDKGIHIMMEMVSCFSGGFVDNLKDSVENIYTGASEDTKHYNRYSTGNTIYAADELGFLANLTGIDTDSWNAAADAATAIDDNAAEINQGTKNIHMHEQTLRIESGSLFQAGSTEGEYNIMLDLPDDMVGDIYDFEFILGLQTPRWSSIEFPDGLPEDWLVEDAPGGIRVFSESPISDEQIFKIKIDGAEVDDQIRIEYTDVNHKRLGYTMATAGSVELPAAELSFADDPKVCVNHTDHGQSSPSIMEWLIAANQVDNTPFSDIQLTVKITTPGGVVTQDVTLNATGQLYLLLQIFSYGNYQMEVIGAKVVPTNAILQLIENVIFPFSVTSTESNKGQCTAD
jgi:hypothetical protein